MIHLGSFVGAVLVSILAGLAGYLGLELGGRDLQASWWALVPLVVLPLMACSLVYYLARVWP